MMLLKYFNFHSLDGAIISGTPFCTTALREPGNPGWIDDKLPTIPVTVLADYAQFNRERSFKTTHCTAGPPGWGGGSLSPFTHVPEKPRRLEPIMPLQLRHPAAAAACDALSPCSRFIQLFRIYLDAYTYYTAAAIWVTAPPPLPRFHTHPRFHIRSPVPHPLPSFTPIMVWQLINRTNHRIYNGKPNRRGIYYVRKGESQNLSWKFHTIVFYCVYLEHKKSWFIMKIPPGCRNGVANHLNPDFFSGQAQAGRRFAPLSRCGDRWWTAWVWRIIRFHTDGWNIRMIDWNGKMIRIYEWLE